MPVNTPRIEYVAMMDRWARVRDCNDGSDAVKAAGTKYLPMLDSHKTAAALSVPIGEIAPLSAEPSKYAEYKLRALFYNATGRTVDGLAGAIFQKPPVITLPAPIEDHAEDVTLSGVSAEMFGLDTTREILITGRAGALVDMPAEQAPEQRPYWVLYRAEDITSWRTERRNGDEILTRVILREIVEEPDPKDEFARVACEQYRVLDLGDEGYTQTVWRRAAGAPEYVAQEPVVPTRRGQPLDFIPFVFIGPTSVSPKIEKPPLLDLADVNLSHYRGAADLKHGLHFAALPTPWVAGLAGNNTGTLSVGSGKAWVLEKDGNAGMLEVAGPGFAAIRQDLQDMQRMMATLGARLLEEQASTAETASAVGMRHAGEHATLRTIAASVEQGLTDVCQVHAWWMGTEAQPEDTEASYELNKEFFTVKASPDEVRAALLAYQADAIAFSTFYERLQRGGWAREGVTADDERAEIERQVDAGPEQPASEPQADGDGGEIVEPGNPWRIEQRGRKYVVLKSDTGEVVGTHDTEEAARAQLKALHAKVKE